MNIQTRFNELIAPIPADMHRLHIPGLALGITYKKQIYTANFGVTNLENPLPVTENTLFQIGSITKTFTALAAQRLVEQDALDLDVPVRNYLPGLRLADESVAARVTARHLFTHTGGWVGDYFDNSGSGDDALEKILPRLEHLPQQTPLGEYYSYNNAGFYIAGRLIESIFGKPFEAVVQELVLDPLGMRRSFFFAQDAITYRVAAGHDAVYPGEDRQPEVMRPWWLARCANPTGGLVSTVVDLLTYAQFQMGDGGVPQSGVPMRTPLLSSKALKQMHTPSVPAANGEWVGLAWFLRQIQELQVSRHNGGTNGQQATLQIVPQTGFAMVALTNSDRGSELYTPLVDRALEVFLGVSADQPKPRPASAQELEEFPGRYVAWADDLMIEAQDGELVLHDYPKGGFPTPEAPAAPPPPPVRLAPIGIDTVIVLEEPGKGNRGEFLRGSNNQIAWFRFGGRLHQRQ